MKFLLLLTERSNKNSKCKHTDKQAKILNKHCPE